MRCAGVDFIEALIKLCGANPGDKIEKKHDDKEETLKKEIDCYFSEQSKYLKPLHVCYDFTGIFAHYPCQKLCCPNVC